MKEFSKQDKKALIIAIAIVGAIFIYSYLKKPKKPTNNTPSSNISDNELARYFDSLPQDVKDKINLIVANGLGENANKEFLTKKYKDGFFMYIERWYSGVNRRVKNPKEGTVFIYGNSLYDSFYGKQRNNTNIFDLEMTYKAVTLNENGRMSINPTKTSSQTSTIVKGTNLGDITNAFYNKDEDSLYYFIQNPSGAGGMFKYVLGKYIKIQEYKGRTLISTKNGIL
jgi:hypothetical protein